MKSLKILSLVIDDSIYEDIRTFLNLANKKQYYFMSFDPVQLSELEDEDNNQGYGQDVVIVYSKEKFTRTEAKKFLKSLQEWKRYKYLRV